MARVWWIGRARVCWIVRVHAQLQMGISVHWTDGVWTMQMGLYRAIRGETSLAL
jgi:hypothetical protein